MSFNRHWRREPHEKQYYVEPGAPWDRRTILKVGDRVVSTNPSRAREEGEGTVVKMTRSTKCTFVDWFIKVKLDNGGSRWTSGAFGWDLVEKVVPSGPRLKRQVW